MNLQSMLLIGILLGNNVATDIEYYENVYVENYNQKQEKMYIEQAKENPKDIEALTELAEYYEEIWGDNYDIENLRKAEDIYKEIIKINPQSTELVEFYLAGLYRIGDVYIDENGNRIDVYKKAEQECLRLLESDNKNIEIMTYLGDIYESVYTYLLYNQVDDLTCSDFFDCAEKAYLDVLAIDPNNVEVRYKLIGLYENEFKDSININNNWLGLYNVEQFEIIEQQYLAILNVDKDDVKARRDLIYLYIYACSNTDIDCTDKIEKQFLEISQRENKENKEEYNVYLPIDIGQMYEEIWDNSDYTDNNAFERAEYYYKYVLDIEPDNTGIQYSLIELYESAYYYGNMDKEESFDKLEEAYKKYWVDSESYYKDNVSLDLARLYESKWLSDKSDYTYYYMAEDEYCSALNLELKLEADNISSLQYPYDICMRLVNLYIAKYKFDGDTEAINNAENVLIEQISTRYIDELAYLDGGVKDSSVNKDKLEELGILYCRLARLNTGDMQYYGEAEKILLKSLDTEKDYDYELLLRLADLYIAKYEFDDDINELNKSKKLLLEQISSSYSDKISTIDSETNSFYVNKMIPEQLGNLYYRVWQLDTDDMQYYEKAEKEFLKSLDEENDYFVLFELGELYTERWLLDKSDVQYKEKALACFNKILANDDVFSYEFRLKEDVYPFLEKLKM